MAVCIWLVSSSVGFSWPSPHTASWRMSPGSPGQQGPEGMAHWDHRTARHAAVADDPVEIDPDEIGDEQERFAELSVQALRCRIEFPDIGGRGTAGRRAASR